MPVLDMTTKAAEDFRNPSWRSETGYPTKVMGLDGNRMQFCPPMAGLTPIVGFLSAPDPLLLASPTGTPDVRIPEAHHAHLPLAALYLLLTKDGPKKDVAKANKYLQDFMQLIGAPDVRSKDVSASK